MQRIVSVVRVPLGGVAAVAAGLGALCSAGGANAGEASPSPDDAYTPVVARVLAPGPTPVAGTDGQLHLLYELELVNAGTIPATVTGVRLVDAAAPHRILASFAGAGLLERLRSPASRPVETPAIPAGEARLFLVDAAFDGPAALPAELVHVLELAGAASPAAAAPSRLRYAAAPLAVGDPVGSALGPPLRGGPWIAVNGCCAPGGVHRSTGLPVNGLPYFAQRFAIDWMRLDTEGRLVAGDAADVRSYASYGAEVIAPADGLVRSTLDSLPDQPPGQLPDPGTITVETVDGNHVILELGDGRFALFAHLAPGSVAVRPGEWVARGQLLGRLGNSGNTSAPHLHVQLMDGPSALGANGLPYVLERFDRFGRLSRTRFYAAPTLEGTWNGGLLPVPEPRAAQFPLDLDAVAFPE